jgi:hypothetical protein
MPLTTDVIVRVAHADIAMQMAYPRSVAHWHEADSEYRWKSLRGDCGPVLIGKNDGILIEGNCSNSVSAPHGGLIHINGDLRSTLDVGGHYEIVVAGDVSSDGLISASGFCHVFVGGRFSGELRSSASAKVWIGSDFDGSIKTGTPSTKLYVGNRYNGSVSPLDKAALLWLTVAGFAAHRSLLAIVECGYTQFHASIARGDVPPGLYPKDGYHRETVRGNSFNRWCVTTQGEA